MKPLCDPQAAHYALGEDKHTQVSSNESDVELVDPALARHFLAAKNGDEEAFSALHCRFASTVHGILLSRVGPAEAEDLMQDAFLKIYRGLTSVRDVQALPAWICTLTRNLATDQQRRQARYPKNSEDSARILDSLEGPEDNGQELRQRVWLRIQELPKSYRETLILRLVEGLSGPEIAARTGLKATSVRVNLCRGMAMLRPLLQKDGWS
jgi:RNA polymerase sigma-70 factor, ECF subfamily